MTLITPDHDQHGVSRKTRALIDAWRSISEQAGPRTELDARLMGVLSEAITASTSTNS